MTACLLDRTPKLKVTTHSDSHKSEFQFVSSFRLCGLHPGGIISQSITRPLSGHSHPGRDQKEAFQSHGLTVSIATLWITIQQSMLVRLLHNSHQLHGSSHRPSVMSHCCCHVDIQSDWSDKILSRLVISRIELQTETHDVCGKRANNRLPYNQNFNVCLLWLLCKYLQISPQGYPVWRCI